jgi:hypothetical protein
MPSKSIGDFYVNRFVLVLLNFPNVIKLLSKSFFYCKLINIFVKLIIQKPTTMKNVLMAMLVVSFATFAQNNKPQLEAVGDMVKVTYLHDNGQVQQGF